MNRIKKIALATALLGATLSASGCGKNKSTSKEGRLYIVYYPGGYGKEYLETFVKEYIANVRYDGDVSKVVDGDDYYLKADVNATFGTLSYLTMEEKAPDIIIAGAPASGSISQGLIEPLTDLFNESIEVTADDGSKVSKTIREYTIDAAYMQFEREMVYGRMGGKKDVFAMPWTTIPLSFAYDETIMKNTEHLDANGAVSENLLSGGKWVNPPETYEELLTYLKDVDSSNAGKSVESKITPFAWASKNSNWFESLYMSWWAEAQGLYTPLIEGQGSFYDFWNLESYELYKQTGIQTALDKVKGLLYNGTSFQYSYYNKDNTTIEGAWMQSDFAKGNAAVCLTGDFFAKEYASEIAESGHTFKMMRTPTISNNLKVSDGAGGQRKMNTVFCNADSSAYIPANAKNKDLAKGFLKYSIEENQVIRFTELTGCLKPFNVNVKKLSTKTDWNPYVKSILDLYFDSDEVIYKFPETKKANLSPIYTNETIRSSFVIGTDYQNILFRLRDYNAETIMVSGMLNQFKSVYAAAQEAYTKANVGYETVYRTWLQTQK